MTVNLVLPFLQGVITTVLFILVLRQKKQTLQTRVFSVFLLSMSLWGFLIGVMRGSTDLEAAVYWDRAALVMIGLTGVSFCYFSLSYTGRVARKYVILMAIYLLSMVAIIPTSYWVSGMWVDQFGNNATWGPAFYPWMVILYSLIVISIVKLNRARLASTSYEERNRLSFFIFGACFCLLGGILDVSIYPGSIPANIFFGLLTSLAILRYHLFDIRVVLRSSVAYLITGFLVGIPTVGAAIVWAYFVNQWDISFWAKVTPPAFLILAIPPLWLRAERFVTRHVRSEKYAYLKALEQFSNSKVNVSKLDELCTLIVSLVDRAIDPTFVYLFVEKENGNYEIISYHDENPLTKTVNLHSEHPLVQVFQRRREYIWRRQLSVFPELQAMSKQDSESLNQINAEIYFPIGAGELSGILALGPKPPGQIYSREDLEFLNTLLRQVSLELENVYLFNREKAQRQRVEQFNAERATFLDALAHEMKTPLTSAVSSAELLVNELKDQPGDLLTLAEDVQSAVNNLGHIVNDILEFGRVQKIQIHCDIQPVDLNDIILRVKEESNLLLLKKQQTLTLDIPETNMTVKADASRIKQVLHNLISNASKFSPVNCEIQLRAMKIGSYYQVEVHDCAERIADGDRRHIFSPYYRGSQARQHRLPGLGLGLYVCKELIDAQKGRIWLDDRISQGYGNIFAFSLPLEESKRNENTDS